MKIVNFQRGVSLYLAVLIMSIMLALALGVSAILYGQIKVMKGMGNSVMAFYAANTGIEKTIYYDSKVIPLGGNRGLCYVNSSCSSPECQWACPGCGETGSDCGETTCTDCTVIYESNLDGKTYRVEATISGGLTTIKSTGEYEGTKRAIKIRR